MKIKNLIIVVLSFILLVLLVQNLQYVSINFLIWKFSLPKIILLIISATIGFVIGYFIGTSSVKKVKQKLKAKYKKK
jgi:uncharacterized integral membrane protein